MPVTGVPDGFQRLGFESVGPVPVSVAPARGRRRRVAAVAPAASEPPLRGRRRRGGGQALRRPHPPGDHPRARALRGGRHDHRAVHRQPARRGQPHDRDRGRIRSGVDRRGRARRHLSPRRSRCVGHAGGVLILAMLDNTFNQLEVNAFAKDVARGVIIIAAVAAYSVRGAAPPRGGGCRRRPDGRS